MNTKSIFIGAAGCALLLAGCGTDEPIYFASAAKMPAQMAEASATAKGLTKEDEHKIDMAVFSYLLDRHFWEDGNYTALFLQADDEVVEAMIKKYPKHNPPIKQSYHIDLRSNQSPLDKDTGKPVMILGADVSDPNADGTVDVIGRWYAGGAVQGFYTFSLRKTGDDWPIVSVK
jgi:predicted small lipoprotein YifL